MKEYKMKLVDHFRHLWIGLFLLIVVPIVLHYLMIARYSGYSSDLAINVSVFVFVVLLLPVMLLHINYFLLSIGKSLHYDKLQGLMIYEVKGKRMRIKINDVESIKCYKSWPLAENRTPMFPWDLYNYAVIKLKDGSIFKIPSLVIYEFDKEINIDVMKVKKTFYPWIM